MTALCDVFEYGLIIIAFVNYLQKGLHFIVMTKHIHSQRSKIDIGTDPYFDLLNKPYFFLQSVTYTCLYIFNTKSKVCDVNNFVLLKCNIFFCYACLT